MSRPTITTTTTSSSSSRARRLPVVVGRSQEKSRRFTGSELERKTLQEKGGTDRGKERSGGSVVSCFDECVRAQQRGSLDSAGWTLSIILATRTTR